MNQGSNNTASVEHKIRELLSNMTVEEKIAQLLENWGFPGVERLNVPPLYKSECVHGYAYGTGATIFPHAVALASTWDRNTVEKVGRATGEESKAANAYMAWTPVLDIARDMRWGRVEESYGEDPCLVTEIGMSWIDGYQSCGLSATPKHFAAHGAPLGGRDSHYVGYSERMLREVFLVPFREAVKKHGVKSVMSAYHFLDGIGCSASRWLLTKILREEWGFTGFVVTDVGAPSNLIEKHSTARDAKEAAVSMIKAGVNSCSTKDVYQQGLPQALSEGLISVEEIDSRVADILRVKFELGLFDREENPPMLWADVDCWDAPEHRAAALEAARKAIVLLKNEGGLLPLSKQTKRIALIGPAMKSQEPGDYTCEPNEGQLVTIFEGIQKKLGGKAEILYAQGCSFTGDDASGIEEAVKAAAQSDVAVIAVGDHSGDTTGEGRDRACLDLTGRQNDLIKAVAATGKPVVLVLATGKPATIEWAADNIPAILVSWYSGEEGGNAVADVLFGDYNPAGRLPVTWPRSSAQLPLFYNYHLSGRGYDYVDMPFAPRYRFGYGLSYTSFEYGNLKTEACSGGRFVVTADVRNTGARDGEEVVQLYVTQMVSSVSTPVTQLKGFERVALKAGETKTVHFELTAYDLSLLDLELKRKVEAGDYKVMVGGVSPDCPHTARLKEHIGYASPAEGVSCLLHVEKEITAIFDFAAEVRDDGVEIRVKNLGGVTDFGIIDLYVDGRKADDRHFEAEPGEEKAVFFPLKLEKGSHTLTAISDGRILLSKSVG